MTTGTRRDQSTQEETPVLQHWGNLRGVISTKHKKLTMLWNRRQSVKLKRVKAWATAVSAVLLAFKLLVEIIRLILT
jgi:hypothetical protein